NVGTAFVLVQEAGEPERKTLRLHFAGGSNPETAHGILYAGSMEESITERFSTPLEATYFGFQTDTPEAEPHHLRTVAFESGKACAFRVVEGWHQPDCVRNRRAWITLPDRAWLDLADLIAQIRSKFAATSTVPNDSSTSGAVPGTFLYSTLAAIRSDESRST